MLTGKHLKLRGWPEGKIIGLAKAAAETLEAQGLDRETILDRLDAVRARPDDYLTDPLYGPLASECVRRAALSQEKLDVALRTEPLAYAVWGAEQIEPQALAQMENALRLPVAVAGALMPDAHVGYGLPIGGVLATEDAVIPYAVGVDIACRMRLSIYEVSPEILTAARCGLPEGAAGAHALRHGRGVGALATAPSTPCWTTRPGRRRGCSSRSRPRRRASSAHRAPATTSSSGASSASTPTTSRWA